MLGLGAILSGIAWAEMTVKNDGTVLTIDVPPGESGVYGDAIPSTLAQIVKTGGGTCEFAPSSVTFTGTVDVRAGVLHGDRTKFGTPANWKVATGASLRFDTAADYADGETGKPSGALEIGSMGCNGEAGYSFTMLPADVYSTSHNHFAAGVKLTGDTSVSGGRFGFGKLDMQGHSLYTYCTNGQARYEMYYDISNPGDIHVKAGQVLIEQPMKFTPQPSGQAYVLANGATAAIYNYERTPETRQASMMDIKLESGASATLLCDGGWDKVLETTRNTWLGDWHLESGNRLTLDVSNYRHCGSMRGAIYGGEVFKTGSGVYTIAAGAKTLMKKLCVDKAALNLEGRDDGSAVPVTNIWTVSGAETGEYVARLKIKGTAKTTFAANLDVNASGIHIARSYRENGVSYKRMGIVEIEDGAVVSNNFRVGRDESGGWHLGGMAGVYMNNATVHWPSGVGNDGFIGQDDWGYGYWCQNGGTFTHGGYMNLGSTGHGCIDQRGGVHRITTSYPLKFARTGSMAWGCYYQTGGTFEGKNAWFNYNYKKDNKDAISILTTTGPNSRFACDAMTVDMSVNDVYTYVNVNDGATLEGRLSREIRYSGYDPANWKTEAQTMTNTTHLYVNLNGGILKNVGSADMWGSDRMHGPTRATVYEKGVTFDTTDCDILLNTELVKPFGKGLKSIAVIGDIVGANKYVGSPRIKITSSTGSGASAFAVFDEKTRTITRIDITSPGCGYEDATIVIDHNLMTDGWNPTVPADKIAFEELVTTGGVRKVGTGTLTLTCANTYGGTTRVEGGTIAFTHEDGLPGGDIEFSAEAVVAAMPGTPLLVADTLKLDAGKKIRITGVDLLTADTFGRMRTLVSVATPMTAMPAVELVDSNGQVVSSSDWVFSLASDGKTLRFGRSTGFCILLK